MKSDTETDVKISGDASSLAKQNEKLQNDLKFKTSKNIELYQRVFWLEAQLKRQLEFNAAGQNFSFQR